MEVHMTWDPRSNKEDKVLSRLAWMIFLFSGIGFVYYLITYFFVPQFNYTGPDGLAGSDYVTYYLGPQVDEILGVNGSVFVLGDFRSVIVAGQVEISHINPAYASWSLRSPEGFISTPFTLLLFRHSLSRLPFWLSLNLWVMLSIGMLVTVTWWSAEQALSLSMIPFKSRCAWQLLAVALLVFLFAPSLVSIGLGQINPLMLLPMALGVFAYLFLADPTQQRISSKARRQLCWCLGPICLGIAINIKIVPGLLVLFLFALGLWRAINRRISSDGSWKIFLSHEIYFAGLTFCWTLFIVIFTIRSDGIQRSLDWVFLALPRAMNSRAIIAPADLPDLETYVSFLTRSRVFSPHMGQIFRYTLASLIAILAIDVCRMVSNVNRDNLVAYRLRLWLAVSFWLVALFSWTFMRLHYLIMAILVFPPVLTAIQYIAIRSYRMILLALTGLSYIGFSHPVFLILTIGRIPNYVAPNQFPVSGYNLLVGYPATLLLALAIWLTIRQIGHEIKRPVTMIA